MKKHILFISNPISGTKDKTAIYHYIEKKIDRERYDYTLRETQYAGHAVELATQAARDGIDIAVAIGGDGTVNEVASGLVHTDTALGLIPCGSGNGLTRHLDIPMDPRHAIDIINGGLVHTLDYGRINDRPFFCTCGVGFDAYVSFKFAEAGKRGVLTYLEQVLKEGLRYRPETYLIEDETGRQSLRAFLITCANASQYGNNAYIAPEASMKDGLMDITVIEPFHAIEAPQIALQLFSKTLGRWGNDFIKMFRSRKITIHRQSEGIVHCDGDPVIMGKNLTIEVIPHELKVIVNPDHTAKREQKNMIQLLSDVFEDFTHFPAEVTRHSNRLSSINQYLLRKIKKK